MGAEDLGRAEILGIVIRVTLLGAFTYWGVKWMVNSMDPTRKQRQEASERAKRMLSRLGMKEIKPVLNEYEMSIAAQLVDPSSIDVTWADIAGLEDVIEDIKATVILPIKNPELFNRSELHQPPKGVLLHGPPGCGKTMIAKATAREAGARFINLEVPALTDKWYGESQKLAAAVFTLALKLQPCIIFIDEIDTFLRSRSSYDHEATAMMKAQFMILWDGLISAKQCQVIVMGATNRPQDVDKAILRRMPAMFQINLPTKEKRQAILNLVLRNEPMESDVDLHEIARMTEGFSGSDLKELCRAAALLRVKELGNALSSSGYLKSNHFNGSNNGEESNSRYRHESSSDTDSTKSSACSSTFSTFSQQHINSLRSLRMDDFYAAIHKMKESKVLTSSGQSVIGLD